MKNSKGFGVVRIGDKTSHGGEVITAQPTFQALGKNVAVAGDLIFCPKCKGKFEIVVSNSERYYHGKAVAYGNDKTQCGAILISSI